MPVDPAFLPEDIAPGDAKDAEQLLGAEYHRQRIGPHPLPPQDPLSWCAVHQRCLTWREQNYDGPGALCSWCRDPEWYVAERDRTGRRKKGSGPRTGRGLF